MYLYPKDIQTYIKILKELLERSILKISLLDSIFYIESSDKYIILDIEEYALLNRNVEYKFRTVSV